MVKSNNSFFGNFPLFLTAKPLQGITIPVFRNANIAPLKKLQPIVFSHGLSANRMTYTVICRELASCGYFVVCLSHDDRSGMYTPKAGPYPSEIPNYTYEVRSEQVKIRQNELLALADEVMSKSFLSALNTEWSKVTLSQDLVFMGHSFGGITALASVANCKKAKALVVMDPWFYPHLNSGVTLKTADHQKSLIMMSEYFAPAVLAFTKGLCDTVAQVSKFG